MATTRKKLVTVILESPQPKKLVTRYDAAEDDQAMSTAYVSKTAIESLGNPAKIKVTIEAA